MYRPVHKDREEKGRILEDIIEDVSNDLGLHPRRNRINGKGPDFRISFCKKRVAIEAKHWGDYKVGFSCVKSELLSRFKCVRGYRRRIIASNLNFKQAIRSGKALRQAMIKIYRLGFEIKDRKTRRRAYRIIRHIIIRIFGLEHFLYTPRLANNRLEVSDIKIPSLYSKGEDVKWFNLRASGLWARLEN